MYEEHEFAIDPTNPRFKKTKGMQKVLEEGRRRRDGREKESGKRKRRGEGEGARERDGDDRSAGGEDLNRLVERVKKRVKA